MKNKCTDKERILADVMVVSHSEARGRTCGFCHPSTYFFNGKCVQCPLGMQNATPLEDSKLFIPEDVKLANPADGAATGKENGSAPGTHARGSQTQLSHIGAVAFNTLQCPDRISYQLPTPSLHSTDRDLKTGVCFWPPSTPSSTQTQTTACRVVQTGRSTLPKKLGPQSQRRRRRHRAPDHRQDQAKHQATGSCAKTP